jgi:hypothetical protein
MCAALRHSEDRLRVVYYGTDPHSFGPITTAERAEARTALGLEASGQLSCSSAR